MKVLVVEDEPVIALDLETLILDSGFEIAGFARTEAEAISLAPRADIALVDVQLAEGPTGPSIARHLIEKHGIEIIFMTGNPEMVVDFEGIRGHARMTIPKGNALIPSRSAFIVLEVC